MVTLKGAIAGAGVLLAQASAYPLSSGQTSANLASRNVLSARAEDFYLRVMPLGASITAGEHEPEDDTGKNGYRKYTRDALRSDDWKVNMVGNQNRGNMNDNDHEGISGDTVAQVFTRAKNSVPLWKPNIILINAGTNDAGRDESHVNSNGERMRAMIDFIYESVPNTVVVLSTLLPSGSNQKGVDNINEQYKEIVKDMESDHHIILADMADKFDMDLIHDGTHPTVEGEKLMAEIWVDAINKAYENDWISAPEDSDKFKDDEPSTMCKKTYGDGENDDRSGRKVLDATHASITDDGKYEHDSEKREDREYSWKGDKETRVYFAQLVKKDSNPYGKIDDMVVVTGDGDDRKVIMRVNGGDGEFGDEQEIDVKDSCKTRGIRWGDVNADGLDDFICISPEGEMFVSINKGGSPPEFEYVNSYKKPEGSNKQDNVRLGDVDGDGRLDYCVVSGENGNVYCWRNGGVGDMAEYWQGMGSGDPVFEAKDKGDIMGVRLVDLNGDGRADWMWMDKYGKTETWINQRDSGRGMIPRWVEAGQTHAGLDKEVGDKREHIEFGRIFSESGRADYVHWDLGDCDGDSCEPSWVGWENKGKGGKFQKGDGIYWGDMTGSGFDDYIWISPEGKVNVFVNKNTQDDADYYESSAWSEPHETDTKLDRRALHIGDWNGDGKADIIGVTDRASGALRVWLSNWDGSSFGFQEQDVADSAKCDQGWGLGYFDTGIHFADITGSGRVDYICMEPSGKTYAWLRDEEGNWSEAGQIKTSEDLDRANFVFADVNGDGRADMIWTEKFEGDGKVWYNEGQVEEDEREDVGGSAFRWTGPKGDKPVFRGDTRGPNVYYPNLAGVGRADLVKVDPIEGTGWVSFNTCKPGGDDNDD